MLGPTGEQVMGSRGPRAGEADLELNQAVAQLELPIWLVELEAFTIVAASGAALRRIGRDPTEVVGASALGLFDGQDRLRAKAALEAIRDGVVDFYGAHREIRPTETTTEVAPLWVRAVQLDGQRMALVEAAGSSARRPLVDYLGSEPLVMAIGATDMSFTITAVSEDIVELLGIDPREMVGRPLVEGSRVEEVSRLIQSSRLADAGGSVALGARFTDASGAQRELCCILSCLVSEEQGYCFILVPNREVKSDSTSMREAQLEQHLWKIAAEVEASGILQNLVDLPDPQLLTQIGTLSTRQWDVLSRLMRGERVPMIAKELFVSQSTIRNYLTAIFQKFGVHSQGELLNLLRSKDSSSS